MEYAELERRLATLGESVSDRLNDDQRRWFAEFLDAGEYGLALEMVADWLSEEEQPITAAERSEAESLAQAIGNVRALLGGVSEVLLQGGESSREACSCRFAERGGRLCLVLENAREDFCEDASAGRREVNEESTSVGWVRMAFDVAVALECVENAGEGRGGDRYYEACCDLRGCEGLGITSDDVEHVERTHCEVAVAQQIVDSCLEQGAGNEHVDE